jgi:hypothetical protein
MFPGIVEEQPYVSLMGVMIMNLFVLIKELYVHGISIY